VLFRLQPLSPFAKAFANKTETAETGLEHKKSVREFLASLDTDNGRFGSFSHGNESIFRDMTVS
jgi:hypothetical protein